MTADSQRFIEIGQRIQGLREACDVTREEMAEELEVSVETYTAWEETGADVPISAIYHMAQQFGVEFNDILNGTSSKLNTYQIVRAGQGKEVPRNPRYHYEDLAWRYVDKIMQPLLVTIDPTEKPHKPQAHDGQEFNYVLEGTLVLTWGDQQFKLEPGDSVFFNPTIMHCQSALGDKPAVFVCVIAE